MVNNSPDSLARRRLRTLLNNTNYGPKLARLPKTKQAPVLRLVEQNQGLEARKLLDQLDTARRKHNLTLTRVNKYKKLPKNLRGGAAGSEGRANWAKQMKALEDQELDQKLFWDKYREGRA